MNGEIGNQQLLCVRSRSKIIFSTYDGSFYIPLQYIQNGMKIEKHS